MKDVQTPATYQERERRLFDLLRPMVEAYLYFASIASAAMGAVFGIVLVAQAHYAENKRLGKICLILAAINLVLMMLCVAAYVLIIVFAVAGLATYLGTSGAGGG